METLFMVFSLNVPKGVKLRYLRRHFEGSSQFHWYWQMSTKMKDFAFLGMSGTLQVYWKLSQIDGNFKSRKNIPLNQWRRK